ncbi:MAG TPA: hypothetical protein VFZ65_23790 [Planctomycetota bacterium]|nr:hypothetical protein [Planctomycetota bacterium]
MPTLPRFAFVPLLFAPWLAAQTTLIVGAGGFATINAALAAAVPGDIVLVQPGSYAGFQATIGVTIRGAVSGAAFVTSQSSVTNAGAPVHLVDLDLKFVSVNGSTCSLDRCRVTAIQSFGGSCLSATNAFVHLADCAIGAAGDPPQVGIFSYGLFAAASTVGAVDSTIRGRDRDQLSFSGGTAGLYISAGSTFHGSRLLVRGGDGAANSANPPGPALYASVDSTVWISDSTLSGGVATNLGAAPWQCPVDAADGRLVRCTLLPATCAPPVIAQTGALLGVHRAAPLLAGAPLQLDFHAEPNQFVGVFASFGIASFSFFELEQPTSLDLATLFPLSVLVADASGFATGTWLVPPGTQDQALWLQAVTPGPLPLQLSPLTGGVVR